MIPYVISGSMLMFVARGQAYNLTPEHPNFEKLTQMLTTQGTVFPPLDETLVSQLADVARAVREISDGRAELSDRGLFVDGNRLPNAWARRVYDNPHNAKILMVTVGARVRIEGDEDCPDGVYIVADLDDDDFDKRCYVEDPEGVAYFGFVNNNAIKEIL